MKCAGLRKAECNASAHCEWVVGKGCKTKASSPAAAPAAPAAAASSRKAPKEHAKDFKDKIRKGIDGTHYISVADKNGVYRWQKYDGPAPSTSSSVAKMNRLPNVFYYVDVNYTTYPFHTMAEVKQLAAEGKLQFGDVLLALEDPMDFAKIFYVNEKNKLTKAPELYDSNGILPTVIFETGIQSGFTMDQLAKVYRRVNLLKFPPLSLQKKLKVDDTDKILEIEVYEFMSTKPELLLFRWDVTLVLEDIFPNRKAPALPPAPATISYKRLPKLFPHDNDGRMVKYNDEEFPSHFLTIFKKKRAAGELQTGDVFYNLNRYRGNGIYMVNEKLEPVHILQLGNAMGVIHPKYISIGVEHGFPVMDIVKIYTKIADYVILPLAYQKKLQVNAKDIVTNLIGTESGYEELYELDIDEIYGKALFAYDIKKGVKYNPKLV